MPSPCKFDLINQPSLASMIHLAVSWINRCSIMQYYFQANQRDPSTTHDGYLVVGCTFPDDPPSHSIPTCLQPVVLSVLAYCQCTGKRGVFSWWGACPP